ncbi:MAG: hypothetical protein IJ996_02815 [Clostridia bacterium]|nr:hypothetical protein [Clostridia bacterium]
MQKLVLIDGNSLLNRAFYATPAFTTKDGTPTNGVFGFIKLMLKIIADKKPGYFAVAFDVHAPTFRHKMYDAYKAGRNPMPDELAVQMPILKDVLRAMNVKIIELPGYEADDILGTVSKRFEGVTTYIYTGDRDSYQLVDESTHVCYTRKGVSDILELTLDNFKDETGLTPLQIIDLKALMGDKSDNIPGVAGVGEKSALSLLERFKDLDGIYAHLDEVTGALHTKLETGKEDAYFSKTLATIDTNVPLEFTLGDCVLKTPFDFSVKEKFAQLEFKSLVGADIFEEQTQTVPTDDTKKLDFTEIYCQTIEDAVSRLQATKFDLLTCDRTDKELRILAYTNGDTACEELVLCIKESLLDTGFFEDEFVPVLRTISQMNATFIAYNVKEWMHRFAKLGIAFPKTYEDVSILKCVAEGLGNGDDLAYCLNQNGYPENARAYGLFSLYQSYVKQLSETEEKLYREIELPLIEVLFSMEKEGVCVDFATLSILSSRYAEELTALKTQIWMLAGEEFNVNSTQQLGKILFDKLKIGSGSKKKDSKNYKTTAEELEKYADSHEIVRAVLRYRKIQKLYSTYVEGFKPLIDNGKVHTTYNQSLTATGRLSSMNPNVQNIPVRTEE